MGGRGSEVGIAGKGRPLDQVPEFLGIMALPPFVDEENLACFLAVRGLGRSIRASGGAFVSRGFDPKNPSKDLHTNTSEATKLH